MSAASASYTRKLHEGGKDEQDSLFPAPLPCIKTNPMPNAITTPCRLRLKICLTALSLLTAALPVAAAPETAPPTAAKTTDTPLAAYPKARTKCRQKAIATDNVFEILMQDKHP